MELVSFGQKSNCKYICIELFANKNDNKVETSFPFKDFIMLLKENSIEYSLSKDVGNFLCNNIYYEGMQYIKDHSLDIKMIFLHIPEIDTKYDFDKIAIIISILIAQFVFCLLCKPILFF